MCEALGERGTHGDGHDRAGTVGYTESTVKSEAAQRQLRGWTRVAEGGLDGRRGFYSWEDPGRRVACWVLYAFGGLRCGWSIVVPNGLTRSSSWICARLPR